MPHRNRNKSSSSQAHNELVLYTYPDSFLAAKGLIAAKYSGKQVKVSTDFKFGTTNKTPEYLAKFPTGKVPALEGPNGVRIFESNAIAYYLASEDLRGLSEAGRAQVIQWISYSEGNISPATIAFLHAADAAFKQQLDKSLPVLKTSLALINEHLLNHTYLVGERISLADVVVASNLLPLYKGYLDPTLRAAYPNVNRWFTTLVHQPEFSSVIGQVALCAQPWKAPSAADKKQAGDSGKKEKKEKPAKEAAAKEDEGIDDEIDEIVKPPKDPFDALPKGTFNFDDFKRFYSNNDTDKSVPYFWEKFDPANYSIWYCEYKFPKELTLVYMSCNLIGGMFQRLDRMRKNSFGSMALFGDDNNSTISGVWVWRGQDLAFKLHEDLQVDYESYEWKKLDPNSAADKKTVEEYFKWEGDFGGKKFNQGKIFK